MPKERKKRVIIIGNSAAALSALEAFRKRDKDSKVMMIDREPYPAYSRVITPYYILGGVKEEERLFLRTNDFYKNLRVKTYFGQEVLSVDVPSRTVMFGKGKKEPFDLLLIATGSSPNRPKVEGIESEEILALRSLSDARKLKEIKPKTRKVLFMGAGLVSLQTLQSIFRPGGRYTLVVKSDRIMSQTLDREGSEIIERQLRRMGVEVIKGRNVVAWKEKDGSRIAVLDHGEEIEADYLFAGKGVQPNVQSLDGSGIKTENGIEVNESIETNIEGIYAAGDVAQTPDFFSDGKVNYGLWPSAVEQGEIAGKNMAGLKELYPGNIRRNVTRVFAMPVASIGDFGSKRVTETLVRMDDKRGIYRKICLDEKGIIIGAILINQVADLGVIQGLIRERKGADFFKANSLWKSPMNYGLVYKSLLEGRL
jgi:nitrite reductase (NADH) large subunit